MRFTMYGQGEGVRSECDASLWVTAVNDVVTDASVSARSKKIKPGMLVKVAQALLPDVRVCAEEESPTLAMQKVWSTLWLFSPWLQTVEKDSFYLQVPGETPPFREVRDVLCKVDEVLTEEQRLRVGFAENPFLAKALVEWSRCERVPGATYRKANRQQLIVSPLLTQMFSQRSRSHAPTPEKHWICQMPIQALWTIPDAAKKALLELGVYRLGDLTTVPMDVLCRHFGKESVLWLQLLEQRAGGHIAVNYPPVQRREVWRANLGEEVRIDSLEAIIHAILPPLAVDLERAGAGALKVGVEWETDAGVGGFERIAKRPVYRHESLYAQIEPGLKECQGRALSRVEVYVEDVRPLSTVQMSFIIHRGALVPVDEIEKTDLQKVMYQVNRKFPHGLHKGMSAHFRELRWRAVSES
jgi:protein ImuB